MRLKGSAQAVDSRVRATLSVRPIASTLDGLEAGLQFFHARQQLRQAVDARDAAALVLRGSGGEAQVRSAGRHILGDAGAPAERALRAHADMPGDPHLRGDDHVVADDGAARDGDAGHDRCSGGR